MTTQTDTDLDDLELLDDEHAHAFCVICNPRARAGAPYTALCGRRAIGFRGITADEPPNICPDCTAAMPLPCSVCGAL